MTRNNQTPPKLVDTFGCSRTGERRSTNGDQFMVAELKRAARVHHASNSHLDDSRRFGTNQAYVLLVADGVGGQPGARDASSLAVDEVMESILNAVPWTPELDVESEADLRQELKETVVRCNDQDAHAATPSSDESRMATSLTMAFVRWPTAFVVHAGNSRAYLVRDGEIERLTTDHALGPRTAGEGELDADETEASRFASLLWNAVDGDSAVMPELTMKALRTGDALLVCSDGLTDHVSDAAIRQLVASHGSAQEACEELVRTATRNGGHDDVTVALARFEDGVKAGVRTIETPTRDAAVAGRRAEPFLRTTVDDAAPGAQARARSPAVEGC